MSGDPGGYLERLKRFVDNKGIALSYEKEMMGIVAQMEKELEEINKRKASKEVNGGGDSIPWWTPRDLRRTVQTRMAEMGARPDVVGRVLNHNVAGVRRHYDHYSYYPEIKRVLVRGTGGCRRLSGAEERAKW